MSVRAQVIVALEGAQGWRPELARLMALALDEEPNAAMARELRSLMDALEKEGAVAADSPLDELSRRRAAR